MKNIFSLKTSKSRMILLFIVDVITIIVNSYLNEEEHGVYRRGRNARSVSPAKNQSITDYRRATGFEALIGHLYLTGQYERLTELVSIGLESIEKEIKEKGAEHAGK